MPIKNVAVQVKAAGPGDDADLQEGQFSALASVFGNVDEVGDVVMQGAFADTLADWRARGDVIPLYWSHRMDDPLLCIGAVIDAKETDSGLQVKAQLDLENPTAAQVYKLLKGRRVSRMSFAYDIVDGGWGERDGDSVYELRKLNLHEVSVVQVPANPAAVVQDVKRTPRFTDLRAPKRLGPIGRKAAAADPELAALIGQADQAIDDTVSSVAAADSALDAVLAYLGLPDTGEDDDDAGQAAGQAGRGARAKAGRVLSAKNEAALRAALTKISAGVADVKSVLAALDSTETSDDDSKASPAQPADAGGDAQPPTVAPARPSPADVRLRASLAALAAGADLTD